MPDPLVPLTLRIPTALLAALEARAEATGEAPRTLGRQLLAEALGLPERAPRVAVELGQLRPEVLRDALEAMERRANNGRESGREGGR